MTTAATDLIPASTELDISVTQPTGVNAAADDSDSRHEDESTAENTHASSDPSDASGDSTSTPTANSHTSGESSTTGSTVQGSETETEVEADADSPLDNAHFLSFEEWKKQNLAKAGQSGEHIGSPEAAQTPGTRRRPGNINNALDSLGEDTEIELDFGGFAGPDLDLSSGKDKHLDSDGEPGQESAGEASSRGARGRSKDAGKTCKERFNYASFDCAANVLKTNPQCKGSSSILVENKDSYMLNECSANNKFVIVELCGDIWIDTIVIANFEFFSSMFRTFRISVSDRYPVKMEKWKTVGTFEARNSREIQAFLIENSQIWARYLRIEFLTHYGNEYYCPVSLLRVHGTTMMEEFKNQNEGVRGDEDVEGAAEEIPNEAGEAVEALPTVDDPPANTKDSVVETTVPTATDSPKSLTSASASEQTTSQNSETPVAETDVTGTSDSVTSTGAPLSATQNLVEEVSHASETSSTDRREAQYTSSSKEQEGSASPSYSTWSSASIHATATLKPADDRNLSDSATEITDPAKETARHNASTTASEQFPQSKQNFTSSTSESVRSSSTAAHPAAPNPTTQENFFKSIHKRLQLLEANATLSLQYIEEQSKILRDAFTKVEKRQLKKTIDFLENLNSTVLNELNGFRKQYDQIWQSTVLELETQREQSNQQILAVSARLSLLADEIIFQKRMSIVQSVLILICLVLVILSRPSASNYLELPIVQSMLSRSSTSLRMPFESPLASPTSTRQSSARQTDRSFGSNLESSRQHLRHQSDSSTAPPSPIVEFSPPTPTSTNPSDSGASPEHQRMNLEDLNTDAKTSNPLSSRPKLLGSSYSNPEITRDRLTPESEPSEENIARVAGTESALLSPDGERRKPPHRKKGRRRRSQSDDGRPLSREESEPSQYQNRVSFSEKIEFSDASSLATSEEWPSDHERDVDIPM